MAAAATTAALAALAATGLTPASKPLLATVASNAVTQLNSYYVPSTGFWGNYSGGIPFWTTANAIESIANYMKLTGDMSSLPLIETSFIKMQSHYCNADSTSCFFDDHLWFVHAWANMYAATGNGTYLQQAQDIYARIVLPKAQGGYAITGAWNQTCGGISWDIGNPYVNAIPNELFLSASMRLFNLTRSTTPVGNFSYQQWAGADWEWLRHGPMPITQPGGGILITDGLSTTNCSAINTGGAYWTYNQGTIVSGLAALTQQTDDGVYASFARSLMDTSLSYFSANDDNVISEKGCGNNGSCGGQDGKQFKGVLVRHLAYALPVLAASSPYPAATLASYSGWILNNTASILSSNSAVLANGYIQFGQLWQGPFQWDNTPWVSQASALDAILAALTVL